MRSNCPKNRTHLCFHLLKNIFIPIANERRIFHSYLLHAKHINFVVFIVSKKKTTNFIVKKFQNVRGKNVSFVWNSVPQLLFMKKTWIYIPQGNSRRRYFIQQHIIFYKEIEEKRNSSSFRSKVNFKKLDGLKFYVFKSSMKVKKYSLAWKMRTKAACNLIKGKLIDSKSWLVERRGFFFS